MSHRRTGTSCGPIRRRCIRLTRYRRWGSTSPSPAKSQELCTREWWSHGCTPSEGKSRPWLIRNQLTWFWGVPFQLGYFGVWGLCGLCGWRGSTRGIAAVGKLQIWLVLSWGSILPCSVWGRNRRTRRLGWVCSKQRLLLSGRRCWGVVSFWGGIFIELRLRGCLHLRDRGGSSWWRRSRWLFYPSPCRRYRRCLRRFCWCVGSARLQERGPLVLTTWFILKYTLTETINTLK